MQLRLSRAYALAAVLGALVAPVTASPLTAQQTDTARVLTIDEYALWRSIDDAGLSPDGRWVSYAYGRREVDDSLFIEELEGDARHVVVRGTDPEFSADSRFVAYFIDPPEDDEEDEGSDDGDDEPSSRAAELLELATGERRRWEDVAAFAFADAGAALIVKKRPQDDDAEHEGTDVIVRRLDGGSEELLPYVGEWGLDERGARLAWAVDGPDGEANGLNLLDLETNARTVLDQEREATYTRVTWGDEKDEPAADALAALKGKDDEDLVERENALLMWPALSRSTTPLVLDPRPADQEDAGGDGETDEDGGSADTGAADAGGAAASHPSGLPADWVLSEKGALDWAPDASRVFVATRPQLPAPGTLCEAPEKDEGAEGGGEGDEGSDTASAKGPTIVKLSARIHEDGRPVGPEEVLAGTCPEFVANVDIWHVKDERLQSVQQVRAERDRRRTYTSVVHVTGEEPRFVQLADVDLESVTISEDGTGVIGSDDRAYVSDWEPSYADHYVVDVDSGERTLILQKHLRTLGLDPDGDHFLYWKDGQVWSYDLARARHRDLTGDAPVSFVDEEFDRFGEKPPHGIEAWTEDGDPILRSRYDLWLQPLDGGERVALTQGVGAAEEIRFRILDLDPEEDEVDLDAPIHLTAFGQWTKRDGFWRLEDGRLEELLMADASFGRPVRADSAEVLLWTREDFRTFPDYHVSGLDFTDARRVTDANPQQDEYRWGRRILFDYETEDGVRLQGTLAIPDGHREGERLPMLVNFYEKVSQNLHRYPMPRYASAPNFAGYVSAGYLVLQPDIHYRTGRSHQQMMESIHLALDRVEEMGYVDPERVGLHGHSYSGQGAAYISTRSDRFAAITAGAAATNLVSDFNQLWKSAGTNQHGYDIYGQGRFATNPYDDFELFVDQSAAQNAHLVETPLLLLHGTDDGSVEWLQAVEFYNGLRWNGKDVILLSYPGAGHGLRQYENQKDFQIRMRQFFDHHLRGLPAPRWMETGRDFLAKQRDLEMMEEKKGGG